jgi:hypothetical protein
MIQIVDGQAQIYYRSGIDTWIDICNSLEDLYPIELYTSINAYGSIFITSSLEDVYAATDVISEWENF